MIAQFLWLVHQPYTLAGFRIHTEDSAFHVTDCFPSGPAYKAGIRTGDVLTRINDIKISEFTEIDASASLEESYRNYSNIYEFNKNYDVECENGFTCSFTIKEDIPFFTKLGCVGFDHWILFITGMIFVIFGIVSSFFAINIEGTSDFVWFMIAAGPCIINSYTDAANTLAFTIFNLISFDLSAALVSFSIFRSVAYFFMISGKEKRYSFFRKFSLLPLCLSLLKHILISLGAVSVFNTLFVNWPMLLLSLSFLFQFVMLIVLVRKIRQQTSVILRFFIIGFSFATIAPAIVLCLRVINDSFWVSSEYESFYTILPLIFIPFSVFCSLLQASSLNLDSISGRLMNGGCSILITMFLSAYLDGSSVSLIFFAILILLVYIVLERPLISFLFPKLEYLQKKLDNLEQEVFRCNNTRDILVIASDWLFSMINMNFVAFCMFSDKKSQLNNIIYQKTADMSVSSEMLPLMIADRENQKDSENIIMLHKKRGFSVPFYMSHELVGYIFVGQKSMYSIFSSSEIRLVPPVARIIMESAMVVELNQKNLYVTDMQNRIVFSFADMIESRDGLTGQHVKRTSQIVVLLMQTIKELDMYENELEPIDFDMIAMAAPLHDIGKIKVPDAILSKPGKLTDEEFAIIKTHPVEGEKIISKTMSRIENDKYLKFAREMALFHHEKWNGTGYPQGLAGYSIPLSARIMAVADVFDALCSARSYKEAFSIDRAFQIFEESKGQHFDPDLVELLYIIRPTLEKIYNN
ncbi:MAG: HD domain-containing protein [Treponemataceae bacterium]|nr:HD domain-containing protein [Treponemataceae bacterium]